MLIWLFVAGVGFIIFLIIRAKANDRAMIETVTTRTAKEHIGSEAERDLVLKLLKAGFPPETIFHDLYIKKPNGGFFPSGCGCYYGSRSYRF